MSQKNEPSFNDTMKGIYFIAASLGILMIILVMVITSGCVTASKEAMHEAFSTPTPTTPPTPAPTFAPLTTIPTQAPKTYKFVLSEYEQGVRRLNFPFTFYCANVSGYKDMKVEFQVYDYKILEKGYTWRAEEIGDYLYQPAPEGYDYLIVFVRAMMDDSYGDPRMYLPDSSHFLVQIGDSLYSEDTTYQKNIRIKELEETFNFNDDSRVRPYGYEWSYTQVSNYNTSFEGQYTAPNAGIVAYKRLYLRGGTSNAEDGYIIYQIPESKVDPIIVAGSFNSFGDAAWLLN